ncbi:MAG: RNA methyltransferase, partial [Thermoguttaceae bacterium]|nr:RNA methyltransferase [Thermoguttaceae bacterium]
MFLHEVEAERVPIIPASSAVFEKLSFGDRDEGVVAVVEARAATLSELDAVLVEKTARTGEEPLVAIVEGVEKPGNIGAILRSADGAGVNALLIAARDYDVFNPNAVRGSLGAIFHLPIVVAPAEEILAWARRRKLQRATALCDDSIPYVELDYSRPTAIVLGSESDGLTEIWARETSEDAADGLLCKIRLPMLGIADSLNVSNAAAVLFYEARRVR